MLKTHDRLFAGDTRALACFVKVAAAAFVVHRKDTRYVVVTFVQFRIWHDHSALEGTMKVLIAYDGSTYADLAIEDLRWAGLPKDTRAMVCFVVEANASHEWVTDMRAALALAESACNRLQVLFPDWDVWLETPSGHAASVILGRAASWPADLIVAGTHGRTGLQRLMLGSVSNTLLHHASCSVRVVRAGIGRQNASIRLLIGNDGSREGESAVDEVCRRSWPEGTEARVISAVQTLAPADPRSYSLASHSMLAGTTFLKTDVEEIHRCEGVAERSRTKLESAGLKAVSVVEENDPRETLLREAQAWNADAIFVGARGLGVVGRALMGSVSTTLVAHAPCTVEVVRSHRQ